MKHKIKHITPRLRITKQKHLYIGFAVFLLFYIPLTTMLFAPKTTTKTNTEDVLSSSAINQEKSESPESKATVIVESAGKMIQLPADEQPVIATITDPSLLQDQDFFQKSQTGDNVLIYQNAKLAVLYRPETQEVITYAEAEINLNSASLSASLQQ